MDCRVSSFQERAAVQTGQQRLTGFVQPQPPADAEDTMPEASRARSETTRLPVCNSHVIMLHGSAERTLRLRPYLRSHLQRNVTSGLPGRAGGQVSAGRDKARTVGTRSRPPAGDGQRGVAAPVGVAPQVHGRREGRRLALDRHHAPHGAPRRRRRCGPHRPGPAEYLTSCLAAVSRMLRIVQPSLQHRCSQPCAWMHKAALTVCTCAVVAEVSACSTKSSCDPASCPGGGQEAEPELSLRDWQDAAAAEGEEEDEDPAAPELSLRHWDAPHAAAAEHRRRALPRRNPPSTFSQPVATALTLTQLDRAWVECSVLAKSSP